MIGSVVFLGDSWLEELNHRSTKETCIRLGRSVTQPLSPGATAAGQPEVLAGDFRGLADSAGKARSGPIH